MKNITIIPDNEVLGQKIKNLICEDICDLRISILKSKQLYSLKNNLNDADILFIDMDIRENDPYEIIKYIKTRSSKINTPIISMSRKFDFSALGKAYSFGCNDFLLKPFDKETLLKKFNFSLELLYKNDSSTTQGPCPTCEDGINLKWTSRFRMNIPEIDEEHKLIIEKFNSLYDLMRSGKGHEVYSEFVDFLNGYVNSHFAHEEALQQKIGYDKYQSHKILHENFKNEVIHTFSKYNKSQISNEELIKLNLFVKNWLIYHILIEDQKISEFIKSNNILLT